MSAYGKEDRIHGFDCGIVVAQTAEPVVEVPVRVPAPTETAQKKAVEVRICAFLLSQNFTN
jgi:predicted transcriptional regulator